MIARNGRMKELLRGEPGGGGGGRGGGGGPVNQLPLNTASRGKWMQQRSHAVING